MRELGQAMLTAGVVVFAVITLGLVWVRVAESLGWNPEQATQAIFAVIAVILFGGGAALYLAGGR